MSYAGQDSRKRDPLYRYEQAEVHLGKAEQLAKAFRQDSQPAASGSSACAALRQSALAAAAQPAPPANPPSVATLPAPVVPLPAPVVPAVPQPEQPNQKSNFDGSENIGKGFVPLDVKPQPVNHGKELLAQARQYLQAGVTKVARRAAEDAYLGNYGVKEEAECVLRDIEAEENSQLALERGRTFDAAVAAYNRGEYAYAGVLLRAIDTRQLDPARQIRYREIMQTVQMQPRPSDHLLPPDSRLVQATQPGTRTTAVPVAPGGNVSLVAHDNQPARACATDGPNTSLVETTARLREVKFQKLRQEGLEAQRTASEKFKSGQTDAALETLRSYLDKVSDEQLNPTQVALLKRPVENRLNQFNLMKSQRDFNNEYATSLQAHRSERSRHELLEANRQKQLAEVMKKYNELYKDHKYEAALAVAMQAKDIDPDNPVVVAAVKITKRVIEVEARHRGSVRYQTGMARPWTMPKQHLAPRRSQREKRLTASAGTK